MDAQAVDSSQLPAQRHFSRKEGERQAFQKPYETPRAGRRQIRRGCRQPGRRPDVLPWSFDR
ncbi:hypothetical protein FRAAL4297 [Frankia alni ACN14a]|uniref:Uncharacterized protein n=1 Tax=Frankia alni (strain DSM 45986 / CECT 9034 / ACN14a) TaxID=326424 RepID=Q0RHT4_FRAAA|nr:hypothetical protein FRAAL4297 [Frankia alni ACN14a]